MKESLGFRAMLRARQEKIKSLVFIGLDPLVEKMPVCMKSDARYNAHLWIDTALWMMKIVDATASYASGYKVQRASWESIPDGEKAMQMVVDYIHKYYPGIVVFGDCKRGDIGRTQQQYKIAHLEIDGFDGMNFSPYMGRDCMEFLVDKQNNVKSIVGLCYTSNPAGREMQDVKLFDGRLYWEFVAETTLRWTEELGITEDSGLVMAAAYEFPKGSGQVYSKHLTRCREIVGDNLWFLVPGVGTQGGFIYETVQTGFDGWGSMAINSSSDIIFASSGEDFAEAAREKARQLYVAIADALNIPDAERIPESRIVLSDPLQTLKNCQGYYKSRTDNINGGFVGPAVAYAGQYQSEEGLMKNFVGFEYFNFAKAEQYLPVRKYFAKLIVQQLEKTGIYFDVVLGAPMGGLLLADSVADELGCRVVFAEKKVIAIADPVAGTKEISKLVIDRHEIRRHDSVLLIEDVCNNFSTTEKIQKLVEECGAQLITIACAFNRSASNHWKNISVHSALEIPTEQFKQEDPEIKDFIAEDEVVWKPKDDWSFLLDSMRMK
jgi:orotidine-5'-phosphate decarboxylase